MMFEVRLTHKRGRPLPHTAILRSKPILGELRVVWQRGEEHPQRMRQATLYGPDLGGGMRGQLVPVLHAPELLGMNGLRFSLSGFELMDGCEHRQSWLVEMPYRANP